MYDEYGNYTGSNPTETQRYDYLNPLQGLVDAYNNSAANTGPFQNPAYTQYQPPSDDSGGSNADMSWSVTFEEGVWGRQAAKAILGSAGQITGGIMGIAQGQKMKSDGQTQYNAAIEDLDKLRRAQPSLGTPTEYYDMVKNAYDQRLMQSRLEDINRGLATTITAASQYGARGLGATLAAVTQQQRAQQEEVYQQQRLQTSALAQLAAARESEIQRREARSTRDIEYAYSEKKAGEARQQYGQQMVGTGIMNVIGGVASAAVPLLKDGGSVRKTPGEFSHKKNPIDIVQGGNKIGEMTGGEYIFNPSQAESMRKYAEGGNTPLHKFVRKTLSKFHKNARI